MILLNSNDSLNNQDKKNKLAEENFNCVYHVARSFANTGINFDELMSIALVGYAKALENYKEDRTTKFSTYAINCMKNEILFFLKRERLKHQGTLSLNSILATDKNGNQLSLEEIVFDDEIPEYNPEKKIIQDEKIDKLQKLVEQLNEKEKLIICYRYELFGYELKTQKEIAELVGMSQANISKIEKSILDKLNKEFKRYDD